MSDLERLAETARRESQIDWDVQRSRAAHARALQRQARRRMGRAVLGAAAVGAVLALVALRAPRAPAPAAVAPTSPRQLVLADGSRATLFDQAKLHVRAQGPEDRIVVEVPRGRVRFAVRSAPRRFRVVSGAVEVTVLGTVFAVERRAGGVGVEVEHGRVAVRWPGGSRVLGASERGLFPLAGSDAGTAPEAGKPPETAARPASTGDASEWRRLARRRQYARAFHALGRTDVRDEPGDLLLAADVARLSGHPAQALRHLERLLARFPSDPRVPTAAFTLGKLRADALGDPRGAAHAFARARAVDPEGTLAPLALAREAEAWSRAGDRERARERVQEYRRRYPRGGHLARLEALVRAE